ncbi:MAG TPA: VCBS repeat-containing protein [Actinomycetes bacterium]
MHHALGTPAPPVAPAPSPRRRRRTALVALLVPVLGAALLAAGPADAATVTPGAPEMPGALSPGKATAPLFPVRSVPGYAAATNIGVRVKPFTGRMDKRFRVPTPAGSTLLWGDWNRDGAYTPAVFTNGHWVVYDAMIGYAPVPSREFDFGMTGDKPVVGDWNQDGRTDIGVVRKNVWLLRNRPDAGATWRRVPFGRASDVPVAGDWDGNGRDGIGVRRGARFFLRDLPTRGGATYDYAFGRASDVPVVGDWNGDGTDAVGVVRGSAWFLRSKSTTRKVKPSVTKQVVQRPQDPAARPAPWPTPAGSNAAACPTASAGVAKRPQVGATVVPSVLLDKSLPYDTADPNVGGNPIYQVRASLLESERYLLGAQYLERWFPSRFQRFTDILSRMPVQEYAVRRPAMAALTTAVAARTKAHSDASAGRTRDEAIRYTDWLVRSIACEHVAVTPGGWGADWQTAHWAMLTGQAAWLVWDYLTPQTREYVAQMVVYEADRRLMISPEYWANSIGAVVDPGDTKAEENSWNAGILELAVVMMPKHAQAKNWRRRAVDLETAAYARFSDNNSTTVVNGVPLQERLDGSNIYDDGTLENHRVIHPDYMTNIQQSWWAADLAGLAGRFVPEAAFHNGALVYGAISSVNLPAGGASPANGAPYDPPGGTMYRPGSNDIYYPQGSVWGTVRRAHFVSFDAHALAYGLDSATPWAAGDALAQHVAGQHALVANNGTGDGRTYSFDPVVANSQENYNGREEYAASQLAAAWLALYVSKNAWDKTFNLPPLNRSTYAPLPPLTQAQTGWFGVTTESSSPAGERLSP